MAQLSHHLGVRHGFDGTPADHENEVSSGRFLEPRLPTLSDIRAGLDAAGDLPTYLDMQPLP
jgi:hypothetical protein